MQRSPLGQIEMDTGNNAINQQSMTQLLQSCNALHAVSASAFSNNTTSETDKKDDGSNDTNNNNNSSSVAAMALSLPSARKMQSAIGNGQVNDENSGPPRLLQVGGGGGGGGAGGDHGGVGGGGAAAAGSKMELADLSQLAALRRTRAPTMSRRNERERNRVRYLNFTFDVLRQHLPRKGVKGKAKKMSKVDTLRGAIDYIRDLQELLGDTPGGLAAVGGGGGGSSKSPAGATSISSAVGTESEADSLSPVGSPRYPGGSPDGGASEALSDREDDLASLAGWFC